MTDVLHRHTSAFMNKCRKRKTIGCAIDYCHWNLYLNSNLVECYLYDIDISEGKCGLV